MNEQSLQEKEDKGLNHICMGILAHVDAGKTTLSEAMLYLCGAIRQAGRVDSGNAFLDTHDIERARGITIFSKQAEMELGELQLTLLDTPGHVDFAPEMERTLQVLDYAILVISAADGVQGHTRTLWRLLAMYEIPVFLFINKMDQEGADQDGVMSELRALLNENCVDFTNMTDATFWESVAVCDEEALEQYMTAERVDDETIRRMIAERRLFPCYFGSALFMRGVRELLDGFKQFCCTPQSPGSFGARVFKISRDEKGNRLTHVKITGGCLRVREAVKISDGDLQEEKVTQIRIYSGERYEAVSEVCAGAVCALAGLTKTKAGDGLGRESGAQLSVLEPVLSYAVQLPEDCDPQTALEKFQLLEEEEPQLHVFWEESLQELRVQIMGDVQLEVLQSLMRERFGISVSFERGKIVYKETITDVAEGVGHFEPLRHYAEVHLLLEPAEPGSGLMFASDCREEVLGRNWQRLILTHLEEKQHCGVLTGAAITDMCITLVSGRAHSKHTEGGDFRQATYRAVRQGLMQAKSVLLEPVYEFQLEIPESAVGRAMTDIERMHGTCQIQTADWMQGRGANPAQERMVLLAGTAPVALFSHYQQEVHAYTKGRGTLSCTFGGYAPCHNAEEVIRETAYDPQSDLENPSCSVFCAHGTGFIVPWDQVQQYMHMESVLGKAAGESEEPVGALPSQIQNRSESREDKWIGTEEVDAILERTYAANRRKPHAVRKWKYTKRETAADSGARRPVKSQRPRQSYLLVDGYNIIFAWDELRELAKINIDGARGALLDMLCNYQGVRQCELIAVFDAYRVRGHAAEYFDYHNIHVVYTKEAETADQYIERFAAEHSENDDVTVATSDGMEQIIIRGQGCRLLSAKDFLEEITRVQKDLREEYLS